MDHLPLPKNPIRLDFEIPYICTIEYDGQDFVSFPQRHGYTYNDQGYLLGRDGPYDLCALYQTWLYLGLMQEIFGFHINPNDFVRTGHDGTSKIIDSTVLRSLIPIWKTSWLKERETNHERLLPSCLLLAVSQCALLDNIDTINLMRPAPWVEVLVSIRVLLATIISSEPPFMGNEPHLLSARTKSSHFWTRSASITIADPDNPTCAVISSQMHRNGWCPLRTRYTLARVTYDVAYYLACLPFTGLRRGNHEKCLSQHTCIGDSIDDSKITRPQHMEFCHGTCLEIEPRMDQVASILDAGGIPLFVCSRKQKSDSWDVTVEAAGPNSRYIAVSHVWADGLGETFRTSIQCVPITDEFR